jgi:hypothetical protein
VASAGYAFLVVDPPEGSRLAAEQRHMKKAIFAVPAALAIGCATMGHDSDASPARTREPGASTGAPRDFDPSLASALKPGVATLEDAKRLLGEPAYTSIQAGKLLCVWSSGSSDGQMSRSSKSVTLAFGPDGKLLESPY